MEYCFRDSVFLIYCLAFIIAVKTESNNGDCYQVYPKGMNPGKFPKCNSDRYEQGKGNQQIIFIGIMFILVHKVLPHVLQNIKSTSLSLPQFGHFILAIFLEETVSSLRAGS